MFKIESIQWALDTFENSLIVSRSARSRSFLELYQEHVRSSRTCVAIPRSGGGEDDGGGGSGGGGRGGVEEDNEEAPPPPLPVAPRQ